MNKIDGRKTMFSIVNVCSIIFFVYPIAFIKSTLYLYLSQYFPSSLLHHFLPLFFLIWTANLAFLIRMTFACVWSCAILIIYQPNKNDCSLKLCKGKLVKIKELIFSYNWVIPMKCDTRNINRYICKICLQYPGTMRTRYEKLLVQNEMCRHDIGHLKRGDLDSDIFLTDNTSSNDGGT